MLREEFRLMQTVGELHYPGRPYYDTYRAAEWAKAQLPTPEHAWIEHRLVLESEWERTSG